MMSGGIIEPEIFKKNGKEKSDNSLVYHLKKTWLLHQFIKDVSVVAFHLLRNHAFVDTAFFTD